MFAASAALAQNPISLGAKQLYESTRNNITKAADKMPEEHFAFKPTPEVRSFGQLVGHVANAQYAFCGAVKGEKASPGNIEKEKTTKADLTAALNAAFAYCDGVYGSMTDDQAAQMVKFFGGERAKISVLHFNMGHNFEHYGNMVTYMRMKGLVPPSSEGR